MQKTEEEVPRYRGASAPLATLGAEMRRARSAKDAQEVATIAARLARQLGRRGTELREAIALAEKSLELVDDVELTEELTSWWVGIGDYVRGAALLGTAAAQVSDEKRCELLSEVGVLNAHGGKIPQALQALHQAIEARRESAGPLRLLGTMGFWADFPEADASNAFLEAAALSQASGDSVGAFECLLSAFEVDPASLDAANALSAALIERGRQGAADDILREHLRHGSAARRAAHHERAFYKALKENRLPEALEASLEAELDLELDQAALQAALADRMARPGDFESFLVHLASTGFLGDSVSYGEWLASLIDVHVFDWGEAAVAALRDEVTALFGLEPARFQLMLADSERIRELREALTGEQHPAKARDLREELARREAARGRWEEAFEALEPLLFDDGLDLAAATLCVLVAGRARDPVGRARALVALGRVLPEQAAAVAFSVASEGLLGGGMSDEAADAAASAVDLAPSFERAVSAQALVALRHPEEASAGQLETSLSVLVARGETCLLLARSAHQQGSPRLALTWAQRYFDLRSGDPQAARALLEAAREAGDVERTLGVLKSVVGQPLPFVELAEDIADSLRQLAQLSVDAALRAAQLVLSRMGIRFSDCRDALGEIAEQALASEVESERTGGAALQASIVERRLAVSGASSRAGLLLELARHRSASGDSSSAARALRRALTAGAPAEEIEAALRLLGVDLEPDAALASLETRVDLMAALSPEDVDKRAELLRSLGAARWDMAQDPPGAINAWLRAADLDEEFGLDRFAHFLTVIAGSDAAPLHLEKASRLTEDPKRQARLLGLAARGMLDIRMPDEAFRLARDALQRAPLLTDNLTVAERAAGPKDLDALQDLYTELADATLGRFGERAVHYRAARLLERRGRFAAALQHACLAFEAVPAEGVAFVLMARLADKAEDLSLAVSSLEKVAAASSETEKARWLDRAETLVNGSTGGVRQRVDILLRSGLVRPEEETIRSLGEALSELGLVGADERAELSGRFGEVVREAVLQAGGAYGATVCVALVEVALGFFEDTPIAVRCLAKGVESDIEVPDYSRLTPYAEKLAMDGDALRAIIDDARSAADDQGYPLGRALAEFLGAVALALGEPGLRAELLVRAASDTPEDEELVSLARTAAREAERPELVGVIEDLLPVAERAENLLRRLPELPREQALDGLGAIELDQLGDELRARVSRELAERQEDLGRLDDAERTWEDVLDHDSGSQEALRGIERIAESRGDDEALLRALRMRTEAAPDSNDRRRLLMRRAVVLETKLGRSSDSRELLEQILDSGENLSALRLLADSWERGGDAARAAEYWIRARQAAGEGEERRDATYRAARAFFEAGERKRALDTLNEIDQLGLEERRLQLSLATELDDRQAELESLVALCELEDGSREEQAERYFRAATLALELGDVSAAQQYAQKAGSGGESGSAARLLAVQLKLKVRPLATKKQAEEVLVDLEGTEAVSGPAQKEMRAYLLAEASGLVEGEDAARRLLELACQEQGSRPLLAVGLAERLSGDVQRALQLYESAIGGDLQGMRRQGDFLLDAAALARSEGDLARARAFASAVSDEDSRRPDAARELEAIAVEIAQAERQQRERKAAEARADAQKQALERAEQEAKRREEDARLEAQREAEEASARAEAEAAQRQADEQKAREAAERERAAEAERHAAEQAAREAAETAEREAKQTAAAEEAAQQAAQRAEAAEREAQEAALRAAADQAAAEQAAAQQAAEEAAERAAAERERAERAAAEQAAREETERVAQAAADEAERAAAEQATRAAAEQAAREAAEEAAAAQAALRASSSPPRDEESLVEALEAGDVQAGLALFQLLSADRTRARDAVVVAGHLVALSPGEASLYMVLGDAASDDGNEPLAAAVRNVLGEFNAADPTPAPPLSLLDPQPAATQAVLWRGARSPVAEAMGLVWEHASGIFKKDVQFYGVSGVERVPLTAPTPLGELYRDAARALGMTRTPVFRAAPGEVISMKVALLNPPAVIVGGTVTESSTDLAFHLGAMLAAASPEHALLFGCQPQEIVDLLQALSLAFGPAQSRDAKAPSKQAAKLSALLWEAIPGRVQRRLSELCKDPSALTPRAVTEYARLVLRRAGLVTCGSLSTAVADACYESGLTPPTSLRELGEVAEQSVAVADLISLATSPEYAELRFRVQRPSSKPRPAPRR